MTEIEMPSDAPADVATQDDTRVDQLGEQVVQALLRARGEVSSRNVLAQLVSGRRATVLQAIDRLVANGRIEGGRGRAFRIVT